MHIALFVLALGVHVAPAPAPEMVRRCEPGSKAGREASALVSELDAAVRKHDADAVKAVWGRVKADACLRFAFSETPRAPSPGAIDMAHFADWWERGGFFWLETAVAIARAPTVVPPDVRPALDFEAHPGLRRLVCEASSPGTCGRDTAGWALRFEAALGDSTDAHAVAEKACADGVKASGARMAWSEWRACLESKRGRGPLLPLEQLSAPSDGWVVLRGRRGHYGFCDEVRVYALGTGDAWVAQSCSGLMLRQDGSVDGAGTDARRRATVQTGTMPVGALREAMWTTLLAPHLGDAALAASWSVPPPKGLKPEVLGDRYLIGVDSFWMSSSQTTLTWTWQGPEGVRDAGTLVWPNSASLVGSRAALLWRAAEASFVAGCTASTLPAQLIARDSPGVSGVDASPESVDAAQRQLISALYASDSRCEKPVK